ncbi:MAG: hypothetical protein H3C35_03530 [Bacteroidetes bacterium]|nr:hypothetical protein [Bacteroidota bacterium]
MTQKQSNNIQPSGQLKNKVKMSGINLIVIAERSQIRYPRLRSLINGNAKMLYDEGIAIESALQQSLSVVRSS